MMDGCKTHWAGCWRDGRHAACARDRIDRIAKRLHVLSSLHHRSDGPGCGRCGTDGACRTRQMIDEMFELIGEGSGSVQVGPRVGVE